MQASAEHVPVADGFHVAPVEERSSFKHQTAAQDLYWRQQEGAAAVRVYSRSRGCCTDECLYMTVPCDVQGGTLFAATCSQLLCPNATVCGPPWQVIEPPRRYQHSDIAECPYC